MVIGEGVRIGPYLVVTPLGAGGMATVYRARDTRLGRDVAIKVLPESVDANQRARIEREARILASLNHPNIAALYGIEESDGQPILVLELVEGMTLDDRLASGPLRLDEAVHIATQIVDALAAGHERGIVHRDLKPANIVLRPDDAVKLLDFGLAKELAPIAEDRVSTLTIEGTVVGTTPYMSPEQARGAPIDQRTDIWAFGCVLYEMVSGRRVFDGATRSDVLAAIIARPPDWSALPVETPAPIGRLLRRCLEKDPRNRLQHIGDARFELREALESEAVPVHGAAGVVARATRGRAARHRRIWLAAAATILIATIWLVARRTGPEPNSVTVRSSIGPIDAPSSQPFGLRHLAVSHDGSRIAYVSGRQLYLRRMDRTQSVPLSPQFITVANPFFSPDVKSVAFTTFYDLNKVSVDGGAVTRIASFNGRNFGGTWGPDGTIIFATQAGLFRVSDQGGEPQQLIAPDQDGLLLVWPELLPDGHSLLFTRLPAGSVDAAEIVLLDLKTSSSRVVVRGGAGAQFVPPGYLVYATSRGLRAIAFDATGGKALGDSVPIPDVDTRVAPDNGAADFAVSGNGTLIHFPPSAAALSQLLWVDVKGREDAIHIIPPARYGYPRLSPDGKRVALSMIEGGNRDVYVLDFERGSRIRLSEGANEDFLAVWSADGRRVYYGSNRGGFHIYSRAADGTGSEELLVDNPDVQLPMWLAPGNRLLFFKAPYEAGDIGWVDLDHRTPTGWLLRSKYTERNPAVSPDGRWVAYESDESGQDEIWVRPYPDADKARFPIGPGLQPRWEPHGHELYYLGPDWGMMAVAVRTAPAFHAATSRLLFPNHRYGNGYGGVGYDVASDGRFLMTQRVGESGDSRMMISVVVNWLSELKALVQH